MNSTSSGNGGSDARLEQASRELFGASARALSGHVQSRLTRARFAAIAELEKRAGEPRFRIPGVWLPVGALAAAAVLAVAVFLAQPAGGPAATVAETSPMEDAEMLASNDGPELYADDPDFYEWAGGDAAAGTG